MKFTKMQGCGNDYIYVNCFEETVNDPSKVSIKVSDRHFGIGSDGLIMIMPSEVADFRMRMINADGSEGKMCGNGIRCVGKYVYDNGLTDKTDISVETLSGIKYLNFTVEDGKVKSVRVDMGAPIIEAKLVPAVSPSNSERIIDEKILVNGKEYNATCVSMGNPHCIIYVEDTKSINLEEIGPYFEKHTMFPEKVNTEFIKVISRSEVDMRVWERGSGETFACGTGACASVVASVLNGLTDNKVLVHLLGGDLGIEYDTLKNTVFMTGPAEIVCTGEIDIA